MILPDLQADKVACHTFKDISRRHVTPSSETKDVIAYRNSSSENINNSRDGSLSLNSHRVMQGGSTASTHAVGHIFGGKALG